jgi:anthranilate/para-aminobenzoate synthase component I
MGAVGIADCRLRIADFETDTPYFLDLSVAIRTMTIRGREAIFNVGGGIVIDSVPETEYEETLIKAEALLRAINATSDDLKH